MKRTVFVALALTAVLSVSARAQSDSAPPDMKTWTRSGDLGIDSQCGDGVPNVLIMVSYRDSANDRVGVELITYSLFGQAEFNTMPILVGWSNADSIPRVALWISKDAWQIGDAGRGFDMALECGKDPDDPSLIRFLGVTLSITVNGAKFTKTYWVTGVTP